MINESVLLRSRAVQVACADVRASLELCCGIVALYGLVPLAMGAAAGLEAILDMYVLLCRVDLFSLS